MPSYINERSARPGARSERRRFPRARVLGEFHGRIVAFDAPVELKNIGLGGFSIAGPLAFPVGAEHQFEITAVDGHTSIIKGRAAHASEIGSLDGGVKYLTGFELVVDAPDDVVVMEDLLARLASQAASVA